MDPREAILAVLSTAFARGIPAVGGRVGVLRIEPVWGEEEIPVVLLDFEGERIEIQTAAPRIYKHTLTLNVVIYVNGENDARRAELLGIIADVERIMSEWQRILVEDVDPGAPADTRKLDVVSSIAAGNSVSYFSAAGGNREFMGARLTYDAEFHVAGYSEGEPAAEYPPRNALGEFRSMLASWRERNAPEPYFEDHVAFPREAN
jgi:hypothetical protein